LFVASITLAVAVLPDDGTTSTGTKIMFGIAGGVLGGLLAEALIDNISAAISERIETLPEGVGQGNRIR